MQTKICSKCGRNKLINEFHFRKDNNKYRNECKACRCKAYKIWKKGNREKQREYHKRYMKNYRILKGEKYKKIEGERYKKYRKLHEEKLKEQHKIWQQNNPKLRKYRNEKYKTDIKLKINCIIRSAINKSLKGNKNGKHWENLVGYTLEDLIRHLEAQFKDGMTWNNHGRNGWHIDHKIPISLFNITSTKSKGFEKCWELSNLQPLWAKENLEKHNKLFI